MLRIRNLRVDRGGETICRVTHLDLDRGERVAVTGPNGCGKTTLLRAVAGLETAVAGELETDVPRRERVYVHQAPYLFRGTVLSNAAYGLAARQRIRAERHAAARRWLGLFGVEHLARRGGHTLSGGETRRVALARAFVLEPAILLLDEPLADLDEQACDMVCRALRALPDTAVVIASPQPPPAALRARVVPLGESIC